MRAAVLAVLAATVLAAGCERKEAPPAPVPAEAAAPLSGEGVVRRGVGPECADTWSVETAAGQRLWPVEDPALKSEGLRVRFEAHPDEGAMSFCMAGTIVRFTRLESAGEPAPAPGGRRGTE
jgi:hypothetical protein